MFRHKFFIPYTLSWIIILIIAIGIDYIEPIKNSVILTFLALIVTLAVVLRFLIKRMPKLNKKTIPRGKVVLIVVGFEVGYFLLRGMIPDQVLPYTKITGFVLRYVYFLIILSILFRTIEQKDESAEDQSEEEKPTDE